MAQPAHQLPARPRKIWPAQGHWTWEDYLRLPEDGQRYEIIEGVLYVSPAPSFAHQFACFELAAELRSFVKAHGLGLVLVAPFDVRLPGIAQPVQPDVLFLRRGNEPRGDAKDFEGVPNLIVEVLSPGSSRLDQHVKFAAYEKAGVEEYWLVDPKTSSVTVYARDMESGDTESGEFAEWGRFTAGETVQSKMLDGFETAVADLFPPSSTEPRGDCTAS